MTEEFFKKFFKGFCKQTISETVCQVKFTRLRPSPKSIKRQPPDSDDKGPLVNAMSILSGGWWRFLVENEVRNPW